MTNPKNIFEVTVKWADPKVRDARYGALASLEAYPHRVAAAIDEAQLRGLSKPWAVRVVGEAALQLFRTQLDHVETPADMPGPSGYIL